MLIFYCKLIIFGVSLTSIFAQKSSAHAYENMQEALQKRESLNRTLKMLSSEVIGEFRFRRALPVARSANSLVSVRNQRQMPQR